MNEEIEEMLTAIGALSEMCWVMFDTLVNRGFKEDQALKLTGVFMQTFVSRGSSNE